MRNKTHKAFQKYYERVCFTLLSQLDINSDDETIEKSISRIGVIAEHAANHLSYEAHLIFELKAKDKKDKWDRVNQDLNKNDDDKGL